MRKRLGLLVLLVGTAGAVRMQYPAVTTTLHEQAADFSGAQVQGVRWQANHLEVIGADSGQIVSPEVTVLPFDELLPSWNAALPPDGSLSLEVRVKAAQGWSQWYSFGTWQTGAAQSLETQKDALGQVFTDTLRLKAKATAWQYRVTIKGQGASLRLVALTTSDRARMGAGIGAAGNALAWGQVLSVAPRSQMLYSNGGEAWCSPTSLSMLLAYQGKTFTVPEVARSVYDKTYQGTGNWAFNMAFAGEQGMRAFLTRLPNLAEAEGYILAGIPLGVSIGWKRGELPGAPLPSSTGHLMVLVGFDKLGNPVLNDPAAPSNQMVQRSYPRAIFEKLWLSHSGGLTYVVAPRTP